VGLAIIPPGGVVRKPTCANSWVVNRPTLRALIEHAHHVVTETGVVAQALEEMRAQPGPKEPVTLPDPAVDAIGRVAPLPATGMDA
jgi:hypothetical protein